MGCMGRDLGRMTDWIDVFVASSGFPIIEMVAVLDSTPKLLEWHYQGFMKAVAAKLDIEKAHCDTGLAIILGQSQELARLYILLA
jgi:hypothetical protein